MKVTKLPTLFIHGREDKFVHTYMSQQNYDACCSEKELMLVENAAHAASYYENPPVYEERIRVFLEKYIR